MTTATKVTATEEEDKLGPCAHVRTGSNWRFTWPESTGHVSHMCVDLTQLRESGGDVYADFRLRYTKDDRLMNVHGPVKLNLTSSHSHNTLTKHLTDLVPNVSPTAWKRMVEVSAATAVDGFRQGEPVWDLSEVEPQGQVRYAIEKLTPLGQTSVIYCDGGGYKGWLCAALAASKVTGRSLPGLYIPGSGPVLYLDWESVKEELRRRVEMICKGVGMPVPHLYYRNMAGKALADDISFLRSFVQEKGIEMVFVDSLAPATGAEVKDAGAASRLMDAINSLQPASRICVAHITKDEARSGGKATILGSVMYNNLSRSSWQLTAKGQNPEVDLQLWHRKVNIGPFFREPINLHLSFDDENLAVYITESGNQQETAEHHEAKALDRCLTALEQGPMHTKALAEQADVPVETARGTMYRAEKRGLVEHWPSGEWALPVGEQDDIPF